MRYPMRTILLAISLIAAAARADTIVSGTVSGSWAKADGPFRIDGPVTVPAGTALAIGPGVDVLFDADVPFVVRGRLEAIGAEAKVLFLSIFVLYKGRDELRHDMCNTGQPLPQIPRVYSVIRV